MLVRLSAENVEKTVKFESSKVKTGTFGCIIETYSPPDCSFLGPWLSPCYSQRKMIYPIFVISKFISHWPKQTGVKLALAAGIYRADTAGPEARGQPGLPTKP